MMKFVKKIAIGAISVPVAFVAAAKLTYYCKKSKKGETPSDDAELLASVDELLRSCEEDCEEDDED